MTKHHNPFYMNCIHLKMIYPKTSNINCSHVMGYCDHYEIDLFTFKEPDLFACINNSPYMENTCRFFKSKNSQITLF